MQRPPSQLAHTTRGTVEYAVHGTGPAVLLSHSTGGGYDQGLVLAQLLEGVQGIAVSRAGYLRTPTGTAATPAEMADVYAALLDELNIERAAILGLSGGGMSAAYFALRHPDRCWGLVLADAITKAPPGSSVRIVRGMNSLPDGLAWLMTRLAIHVGLPLMVRDVETRSMMRVFFENHPISARRAGVENDLANLHAPDDVRWEAVNTPALLIHGDRDPLIPLVYSQRVASRMPNAELSIVPGGGHECLVSHRQQVAPRLNTFLQQVLK